MGEGGVYNVPRVRRALLYSVLTCMGIQEPLSPDPPLKKLEAKSLVQPTHLPQNPGCD